MKKVYKIILLIALTGLISCDEELNINTDPNAPAEITPGLALSSAQASLMTVVGGDLMNLGGFYAQYHTQSPSASQYENIDQYNINATYADRLWTELYAGCLNDLKFVIEESEATGDTGTVLIGNCLSAYTFQLLVDLFGDVPYAEALQGLDNFTPSVDTGEVIYTDLLARIDAALAAYQANPTESSVGNQDEIYGGDMEQWVRFANTLKLKMYMRMSYTSMANPTAVTELIAENNFITEDAAFRNFDNTTGKRNPWYEVQNIFLGDINNIASNTLHSFYVENNDPRRDAVYRMSNTGTYGSLPQGAGGEFTNTAVSYARPNFRPRTPVFFMTVAESYFLQAEGLIRYAGGAGAKEKYDAGVLASFNTYQANFFTDDPTDLPPDPEDEDTEPFTPAEATAFAAALTAPGGAYEYQVGGSVEETVRQVMIQKWAALANVNNIEAYIETTRTKFPEVVAEGTENYAEGNRIPSRISVLGGTTVPSILFYPEDEVNRNPNVTQRSTLTENVWWDQKPE